MSMGNMSILLSVYPYYSVLVSDTFLLDATYRLSSTFLDDAIGYANCFPAINHLPPILPQIPDKIRLLPLQHIGPFSKWRF